MTNSLELINKPINLQAALKYATDFGFKVFPVHSINDHGHCTCYRGADCGAPGKHPIEKGWRDYATDDREKIHVMFSRHPYANVAIATGEPSGITILDVDLRNDGVETLEELQASYGELPDTPTVITGSMGYHFFFKYHEALDGIKELGKGIDIKGTGGFVVAAPSKHKSGRKYTWEVESHITDTLLADVPEWVLGVAKKDDSSSGKITMYYGKKPNPAEHYLNILEGMSDGSRNNALASLAGFLLAKNIDGRITFEILRMWNERNEPMIDEDELYRSFLSIFEKHAKRRGVSIE